MRPRGNWFATRFARRYLSWDSTAYPDGKYVLRVTASDAPSNPPDQALTGVRESDPFLIDNTPPEITCWAYRSSRIRCSFTPKTRSSTLGKAEYSVNGGEWMVVEPTTRLTDSLEHDYRVTLANRPPGEVDAGGSRRRRVREPGCRQDRSQRTLIESTFRISPTLAPDTSASGLSLSGLPLTAVAALELPAGSSL